MVLLKPQVFGGPYAINAYSVVKGSKVTASLEDVLFGDVWICSGQSNMEFTVIMVGKYRPQKNTINRL